MNSAEITTSPHSDIARTKSKLDEARDKAALKMESYERKIRQSPDKAVLIAAATGYCLNFVPVLPILAIPLRIASFLAKPAILGLGVVKACEIIQGQVRR